MIHVKSVVSKSNELLASEVDGEIVMMNIESGKYYGTNSVGSEIWKLLDSPILVSDICKKLTKDFEIDDATCETEVMDFLQSLEKESILNLHS